MTTSASSKHELVTAHLGLADHLARRYAGRGESMDDLQQVAYLALAMAAERFDADRGVEFAAFATPTVLGEIKRHFRDKGWAVRVPRQLQELRLALNQAVDELTHELKRSPTVSELANWLSVSEDDVLQGLECGRAYSAQSIDPLVDPDEAPLSAVVGFVDHGFERIEDRNTLRPLLEQLPERERRIIAMRFFENMTQTEIADQLGISQMHVSRLLTRTLSELRAGMTAEA